MTTYNTGNPLGSTDPRDLYDNAENFDEAVNSEEPQWVDRFGRPRLPLMEQERQFVSDQERREGEFQADQSSREAVFSDFLQASGYQDLGEYAPGIEITAHNQYVTFGGQPYLLKPSIPVPYTTSGEWTGEDFKLIGDDSLRQDLANPDKGAAMVARGVVAVDSIADLLALPAGQRKADMRYLVKEYHAGTGVGGGEFYWDPLSTEESDGGVVLGSGTGRFIRPTDGTLNVHWFGAKGDGETDDTLAIQAAVNAGSIYIPSGVYRIFATHGSRDNNYGIDVPSNRSVYMADDAELHTIENTEQGSSIIRVADGVENVHIKGGLLVGDKYTHIAGHEWGHGITIREAKNVTIESVRIKDCAGDGIIMRSARINRENNNIVIKDCIIWDCRRHEITSVSVVGLRVENCKLFKTNDTKDGVINTTYGGLNVDIEPSNPSDLNKDIVFYGVSFECPTNYAFRADISPSAVAENINVISCTAVSSRGGFEFNEVVGGSVKDSRVTDGRGMTPEDYGVRLFGSQNFKISNNTVKATGGGISVVKNPRTGGSVSRNITVGQNDIEGVRGFGISLSNSEKISVYQNTVSTDSASTVPVCRARSCIDVILSANELRGTGSDTVGLDIIGGSYISVCGNLIKDIKRECIYINGSDVVDIINNRIIIQNVDVNIVFSCAFRIRNTIRPTIMGNVTISTSPEKSSSVILSQQESGDVPFVSNNDFFGFANKDYTNPVNSNNNRLTGGTIG